MRAPRCYILFLTAAVKAIAELVLSQYGSGFDGAPQVQAVRESVRALEEHIRGCEECES